MRELAATRDALMGAIEAIDELIELGKREESGEDVKQESELAMAKIVMNFMKLQALN